MELNLPQNILNRNKEIEHGNDLVDKTTIIGAERDRCLSLKLDVRQYNAKLITNLKELQRLKTSLEEQLSADEQTLIV